MAFSESLKLSVKQKAHFHCCLCHALGVEVHHIIPLAEGGSDEEDNAAPLCPTCHETYGANPEKRKFIRETRDFWYDVCQKRYAADYDLLIAIEKRLKTVPTMKDLERLHIQNMGHVPSDQKYDFGQYWEYLPYSFVREEFIHPLIVRDLLGWISDPAETVVAIDLVQSNNSNRFFGPFSVRESGGRQWVEFRDPKNGYFIYSYVATSPSGVHMVECYDNGGGSGVFGHVILLVLQADHALAVGRNGELTSRERILLKTLGSIVLGDRYSGKIKYQDGFLKIGPDNGWFRRGESASKQILIK